MSEKQTSASPKPASASADAPKAEVKTQTEDHGQAESQAVWDEANAQGYWGTVPDETPNDDYTLQGVIKAEKAKGAK